MSAAMLVALVAGAAPATAAEQQTRTVSLTAAAERVAYGDRVMLEGTINPAAGGEVVDVRDQAGTLINQVSTDDTGRFTAVVFPEHNMSVQAQWQEALSEVVALYVRPSVVARLDGVRLFGDAKISGSAVPELEGGDAVVKVFRSGKFLWKRRVPFDHGRFSTSFYVGKPGRFRAVVLTSHPDYLKARAGTGSDRTRAPYLTTGSSGPHVRALEGRLRLLGYHLTGLDTEYDHRTADAVRAFNKVQGRVRSGSVDRSTWSALSDPKTPRPRADSPRFHIEVDQTKQVLYTVEGGKVDRILHVSTGAGNATRDGVFHVHRKLAGYSGNRLYYPSYFDGLRAIHGWPDVPTTNASHGCVRVPMWAAQWIYGLAHIGTEIRIYH